MPGRKRVVALEKSANSQAGVDNAFTSKNTADRHRQLLRRSVLEQKPDLPNRYCSAQVTGSGEGCQHEGAVKAIDDSPARNR